MTMTTTLADRLLAADGALHAVLVNAIADVIDVMLEAHRIYGDRRFLNAALRGGDFMIRAQMPEPQPAWAQQYNHDMEPAWARRFEPPSVTGGESFGVMRALMDLYIETGEERFALGVEVVVDLEGRPLFLLVAGEFFEPGVEPFFLER